MIRFVAALAVAGLSAAWAQAPSAAEQAAFTQKTRDVALRYSEMLPDFVCNEVIHRSWGDTDQLRTRDVLNVQLTYFQRKESYKLVVNGKASDAPYESLSGAFTAGEFGSMLRWVFEPESETEFRYEKTMDFHTMDFHKTQVSVYSFRTARDHSQYLLLFGSGPNSKSVVAGLHGTVYISNDDYSVLRLTSETEGVPFDFPIRRSSTSTDYQYTDVGGRLYLLPSSSETQMLYVPNRAVTQRPGALRPMTLVNSLEFRAYRKFAVESHVDFGSDGKP